MRRSWLVLAAVVAALVLLGPLRGGGGGGVGSGGRHGVLRLGLAPLGSLDPALARSIDQVVVADQLFDSLTAVDPAGGEPRPALAARWSTSPDQRQWDFVLRRDARFANGRPVTPADVKYTLERIAHPGSGSPVASLLATVGGYADLREGASELAGVSIPAPGTVRIALQQPWSELPAALASPVFGVVPREAVEAPAPVFAEQPVGSGPFRLVRRRGPTLLMVPSPGSAARVDSIVATVYDDVPSSYRAFVRGDVDWSLVPPDEVDAAGRRFGRGAYRAYLAELFYAFNLHSPKLADARFREAIVRGIDRRAIVDAVYQGTVAPVDGMVLRGVPAYQDGACGRCDFDPARARALLAEAFPGRRPPELAIDFEDDQAQAALASAMGAGLEAVGVRAVLRPRSQGSYNDFAVSGQQELFHLGWVAAYPSADAVLAPLFRSGSTDNLTGFSDPGVDEELRLARTEPDPARRAEHYRRAERAVMDKLPVIPIAQFELHAVVSRRVRDLRTTALGSFDASVAWLAR